MNSFTRSFALARASWQVLLSEKELLGYTLLGSLVTVIAIIVLAVPGVLVYIASGGSQNSNGAVHSPLAWVLVFILYLVVSFITLFFNTALIGTALVRLRGGDPNFSQGLQIARNNLGHIFVFALISATVGVILMLIEEKLRFVGPIVRTILGAAWGVATFLVVPVMVAEGIAPFDAIKRSTELLRKTWGEQIIGSGGIGLVMFLLALLAVIPVVLGVLTQTPVGIAIGIVIAVLYIGLIFAVGASLSGIYRAAVYLYAETGTTPAQFDGGLLQGAFRQRKGRELSGNI